MRFFIVLDAQSVIGQTYLRGNHDATSEGHPAIDCKAIEDVGPYLRASRNTANRGGSDQTLWIPHHSVVCIVEYAQDAPRPFGFA